jgi:hypothetical protein
MLSLLRRSANILFVVIICFSAPTVRASQKDLDNSTPVELLDNWVEWTLKLDSLQPIRIDYSFAARFLKDAGISSEEGTCYVASKDGLSALELRRKLLVPDMVTPENVCNLDQPKYYAVILRKNDQKPWQFNLAESARPYVELRRTSILSRYTELPGIEWPKKREARNLYDFRELSRTADRVCVQFQVRSPTMQPYIDGAFLIDQANVTFERSVGWLPTRIEYRLAHIRTEEVWFAEARSEWKEIRGLQIPFRSTIGSPESVADTPFTQLQLNEINEVPLSDVQERCTLSYYGLPELDLNRSSSRLWWFALAVSLILLSFFVVRKGLK